MIGGSLLNEIGRRERATEFARSYRERLHPPTNRFHSQAHPTQRPRPARVCSPVVPLGESHRRPLPLAAPFQTKCEFVPETLVRSPPSDAPARAHDERAGLIAQLSGPHRRRHERGPKIVRKRTHFGKRRKCSGRFLCEQELGINSPAANQFASTSGALPLESATMSSDVQAESWFTAA